MFQGRLHWKIQEIDKQNPSLDFSDNPIEEIVWETNSHGQIIFEFLSLVVHNQPKQIYYSAVFSPDQVSNTKDLLVALQDILNTSVEISDLPKFFDFPIDNYTAEQLTYIIPSPFRIKIDQPIRLYHFLIDDIYFDDLIPNLSVSGKYYVMLRKNKLYQPKRFKNLD